MSRILLSTVILVNVDLEQSLGGWILLFFEPSFDGTVLVLVHGFSYGIVHGVLVDGFVDMFRVADDFCGGFG